MTTENTEAARRQPPAPDVPDALDTPDAPGDGYAAARLRLLQDTARSGPSRRAALCALTDEWL
ncbi:hypothetical protein, partial [Streptomyces boncukensis]